MFKKESVSQVHCFQTQMLTSSSLTPGAKSKVKSSAQRAIRAKAIETYPRLEPYMDEIMPKKEQIDLVKVYVLSWKELTRDINHQASILRVQMLTTSSTDLTASPSTSSVPLLSSGNTWTILLYPTSPSSTSTLNALTGYESIVAPSVSFCQVLLSWYLVSHLPVAACPILQSVRTIKRPTMVTEEKSCKRVTS